MNAAEKEIKGCIVKLTEAQTELITKIAVIITRLDNDRENSAKLDKIQIEQGKLLRHIEKDYGERIIKLEAKKAESTVMALFWKIGTLGLAAIAAISATLQYLSKLG